MEPELCIDGLATGCCDCVSGLQNVYADDARISRGSRPLLRSLCYHCAGPVCTGSLPNGHPRSFGDVYLDAEPARSGFGLPRRITLVSRLRPKALMGPQERPVVLLSLFLLAVLLLRLITLSVYPLMDSTEARYAEIAREMVATGNWVTPQLDPGKPYWGKPPLSIWSTALCYKVFGVSEFSARLSSFAFSILTMMLVLLLANSFRGRTFSLVVAIILTTNALFYFMLGGVMTDPAFSFAVTLALSAFMLGLRSAGKLARSSWGYLFFVGIGLSVLAKGLLGIVLVFVPIVLWTFLSRQRIRVMKAFPWMIGSILLSGIVLPWHILAEIRTPGFLEYYLFGEHLQRFFVAGWEGDLYGTAHSHPKGAIWLFLIPSTLPWLVVFVWNLYPALKKRRLASLMKQEDWVLYLLLWFLTPLVLFTFAGNIVMTYVLPGLPAFALLTACLVQTNQTPDRLADDLWFMHSRLSVVLALVVPFGFTVIAFWALPAIGIERSHKTVAEYFDQRNQDGKGALIYARRMPHSADFYTRGHAKKLEREFNAEELLAYIHDENENYYVIYQEDVVRFPEEIFALIRKVHDFGRYSLYQEAHTVPAGSSVDGPPP